MSELFHSFPRETSADCAGENIRQEEYIDESQQKQRDIKRHVIEKRNNQDDSIYYNQDSRKGEIIPFLTLEPCLGQGCLSGSESESHIENKADDIDGNKHKETERYHRVFQTLYEIMQEDPKKNYPG